VSTPPGAARLLIDFLNTIDLETGVDLLDDQAGFGRWSRARGHPPGDPAIVRSIRGALREAVQHQLAPFSAVAVPIRLMDGRPVLAPRTIAEAALGAAMELAVTGGWERVKLCPGEDCLEAFYDSSRNHSRVWCDMAVCGNLTKVRGYRARARELRQQGSQPASRRFRRQAKSTD
jgi:hypothetical protein